MLRVSRVKEALCGRIAPEDSSWSGLEGATAGGKNGVRAGIEMIGSTLKYPFRPWIRPDEVDESCSTK
jgi:hypothetical protein